MTVQRIFRVCTRAASVVVLLLFAGCAKAPALPTAGSVNADKFLFERGSEDLKARKWLAAREYFKRIVDGYPQSPYRPDAKLAVGDAYLGENTVESKILAANEFREFLSYFPTNPRADYAQFKIAESHSRQVLSAQRDQTETKTTLKELEIFFQRFPNSALRPQADKLQRATRDRLSDHDYQVGLFYFHVKIFGGAVDRFLQVLKDDPDYTNRDAVYFYLGECFVAVKQDKIALPWFDRLVQEFRESQYLAKAKLRVAELKK